MFFETRINADFRRLKFNMNVRINQRRGGVSPPGCVHADVFGQANPAPTSDWQNTDIPQF